MSPDERTPPPGDEHEREDGDAQPGAHGGDGEPGVPPPATWAGRARAGDEGQAGDASEPGEPDGEPEAADAPQPAGEPGEPEGEPEEARQQTVEADTLALAEREAAEEAALAGLRARAARKAAERERAGGQAGAGESETSPGAGGGETGAAGEPETAEGAGGGAGPGGAGGAIPATGADPNGAETTAEAESAGKPPRRKALWARFLAAALLIVISTATATSVSLLLVLTDLAQGIGGIPDIEHELTPVGGGDPQTILILGSDERLGHEGGDEGGARSDTAILLRVDPDRRSIGLLSIPRDLRVNIPGVGVDKFNAAYAHGGPKLALRVVKQLTGLDINHVVNINFTGFADAVNAIDCVFIDVDRRYFIPPETGVAEIDIEAGYQRLCGLKALQYVRFRHDDNDLVRAARQQDFLREARQKIPPSTLFSQRYELLDIFKEYTTSDEALSDPIQLLELLKTFLAARKAPVNEIHFPARLGGPDDPYVTANQREIRQTVRRFLGAQGSPGPKPGSAGDGQGEGRGGDGDGKRRGQGQRQGGGGGGGGGQESGPDMVEAPIAGEVAQRIANETTPSGKRHILDFPVEYPAEVPARTNLNPLDSSRAFSIDGPGDEVYHGYKIVFGIPGSAGFTEYWGISGANWRDPPILENPSEVRRIGGREYLLFYDGDRLRLVGWKKRRTSYWVNNTLLQSLGEREMLAIARSMRRLDG